MSEDVIETLLDRGGRLGFVKPTGDPGFLGWVLLSKPPVHPLALSSAEPGSLHEQTLRTLAARPYLLRIVELAKAVHESDDYEANEDYRVNERYYFSSLGEVAAFLQCLGLCLDEIRPSHQIDAP
jgi:hypothetical protein